jgi:hypothetical protein
MILDFQATTEQLRVVKLCYDYAFARALCRADCNRKPTYEDQVLCRMLEDRDSGQRRQHRRFPVLLRVSLDLGGASQGAGATVLDMSAGGAFLLYGSRLPVGSAVKIVAGRRDEVKYVFSGRVARETGLGATAGIAIAFEGVPLAVRSGPRSQEVTELDVKLDALLDTVVDRNAA